MLQKVLVNLSWKFSPPIFLALLISLLYVSRFLARRAAAKLGSQPPDVGIRGPLGLGFFYESIKAGHENACFEWWERIFDRNGCASKRSFTADTYVMGGRRYIITADPENVKACLATDFGSWGKGRHIQDAFKFFLGDGILAADGEKWHSARTAMRPLFIRDRVANLDQFESNVQRLIPILESVQGHDIDDIVFRFTLDMISEFLLGERVGALEDSSNEFTYAFSEVQRVQMLIMRAGPLQWVVPRKSYLSGIKVVESHISPFIDRAMVIAKSNKNPSTEAKISDESLLHALTSTGMDRKTVRDNLVATLFAGSDTTASAMTWVLYELGRNPQVVTKLRKHIHDSLGSTSVDRLPTYEEIKSMKYLSNVVNESLRLYATMPFATRQALRDTTLPRGGGPDGTDPVGVKKDTIVLYSALVMHRRRDLYPSPEDPQHQPYYDPRLWIPERWETWQPKAWQLIPFSGGPRICIGQNFAFMEIAYTVCRLVQYFDHFVDYNVDETGRPKPQPVLKYGIVVTAEEGVKMSFVKDRTNNKK